MEFDIYKYKIEQWIIEYFNAKGSELSQFVEPMVYSLQVGGKRIRPILMMTTYNIYKTNIDEVLPFAAAMEMIHTYSLIHDDLPSMDNDDLRRGKPTNHKVFGEAMAILAGDGLLNEAMIVLLKQCLSGDKNKIEGSYRIAEAAGIEGMIKGQIIDIKSEGKAIDEGTLVEMHKNKTGKLIKGSIVVGAILAGAPIEHIYIFNEFGEKLGLAFQIKDDILDIEGNQSLLGKTQSDGENNKANFVTMYGIDKCKEICNTLTEECYELLGNIHLNTEKLEYMTKYLLDRKC